MVFFGASGPAPAADVKAIAAAVDAHYNHLRSLEAEFTELHNQDVRLPLEERFGTSLLIAVRPWVPHTFRKLQRTPAQKHF